MPLVGGVRATYEPASRATVRFQEIEQDETPIYLQIESPTLAHNLCGDRALNSAPNGIKSSIVLKSGDRAR